MTERTLPEVAAWLDEEAEDQKFFGTIGESLRGHLQADNPLAPVVWAFDYRLLPRFDDRREDHGPFGPLWETTDGQHPPPLSEIPDEAVSLWEKLSGLVTHPFLRARLNDLMWERGWSDRPYLYAVAAIDAYLALAPPVADGMEYVNPLSRAGGLARQINDGQRRKLVVEAAFRRAEAELAGAEPMPGIVLRLLDVALNDREEDVRSRVAGLLEQATEVFDDPWIRDDIIDRQVAISSGGLERRKELELQKVNNWIRHASTETGMRRRFFLMRALEHARTYGFRELAEQIRQEIQELGFGESDIQRISTEVEIPSEEIENTISEICSADTWPGCLGRLLVLGPLSGSLGQNREVVAQQLEEFVFQHLFDPEVLGPFNETVFRADTEEAKAKLHLSNYESISIDMASYIVAEALDEIRSRHNDPIKVELEEFFTTPIIDSDAAERIAASVVHYTRDRFDESVMVLVPRIESTIRQLVRAIGMPTWSEPRSGGFGKQRSLHVLLEQLKGYLDEDWLRYLNTLLVNPLGPNLRNKHMHGLALRGTRAEAAALIHAVVFLASLRRSIRIEDGAEAGEDRD